jgi:hypothetical protein
MAARTHELKDLAPLFVGAEDAVRLVLKVALVPNQRMIL